MKILTAQQVFNIDWSPEAKDENGTALSQHVYLVLQVVDSITPEINQRLTPAEIHGYCENEEWKVTIK